ncbi:MAG: phenylalanine--tRNA ligase subunit beta [Candidatus Marinimicrobia bacterium]|nr:phenylalanine--tRNA ligase subunit beta [Candidatus Neomarinimicrobiota bacterium]
MIVSIDWLKQFVEITESPEDLAELLSKTGLEAEVVGIPHELPGLIVGYVESAEKHPDADKLKKCTVSDGSEIYQVVCGAPNVEAGKNIAFAKVGAVLPGNFKIKKAKIRGVESFGMICSERELLITDEHEGIMVLSGDLNPGDSFMEAYGHKYLSIELDITPNRPDAFSHQGVARDIAAATGRPFNPLSVSPIPSKGIEHLSISMEDENDCPRYIGGIVKNVKVRHSPDWMVDRLKAAGQRSINNLVDISNYVLLEMGHPTHIFDYNKLPQKEIVVRRANKGEKLTTLDDVTRELTETNLLITDGKIPIALAGVMGGLSTSVTEETTTVLVESAYFNPVVTRKNAKSLQMRTDASKRFERGADPDGTVHGFWRVVSLLQELADGELSSEMIDIYPNAITPKTITLRRSELDLVLGHTVECKEVDRILESIGFESSYTENDWTCTPPSFRPDIEREIDVIEEIARMVGYDTIPADENIYGVFRYENPDPEIKIDPIRSTLVSFGFHQIYSNSLQNERDSSLSGKMAIKMMNPLSQEMAFLRTSLLPGLMKAADYNIKHGHSDLRLFELANIHERVEDGLIGIKEFKFLSGIIHGEESQKTVHENARVESLFSLKGILAGLFNGKLNMKFELKRENVFGFDYAQSILINRQKVGVMGRLSTEWIDKMNLDLDMIFGFEINLEPLLKMLGRNKQFKAISSFPKITRDVNLVMPESQPVGPIVDAMIKKGNNLIIAVKPIDVFSDESALGAGMKSVTFSLDFQHQSKTLEDKDVSPVINDILHLAEKKFNAKLRS